MTFFSLRDAVYLASLMGFLSVPSSVHCSPLQSKCEINALESVQPRTASTLPGLDVDPITHKFQESGQRAMIFDYDGTLSNLVEDRDAAVPSDALKGFLARANSDGKTTVAIISGRDQEFMNKHFGAYENFFLAAEYGLYSRAPKQAWALKADFDTTWVQRAKTILESVVDKNPKIFQNDNPVEVKACSVVFHYRTANKKIKDQNMRAELELVVEEVIKKMSQFLKDNKSLNLAINHENLTIETRPNLSKAGAVDHFWHQIKHPDTNFLISMGDTGSDEEMFTKLQALNNSEGRKVQLITGHVTNGDDKKTTAQYRVENPQEAVDLLRRFYQLPQEVLNT